MRDLLPSQLVDLIRDRYVAGVASAEAFFDENSADEDSLTGALGQAIAMKEPLYFNGPDGTYSVRVSYKKLRGRGINAPERLYGADGIFQIAVLDHLGAVLRQKALPFQSKTDWRGRSKTVAAQSTDIQSSFGEGIVIDYSRRGYRACSTKVVIDVRGSRIEADRRNALKPLGQLLGVEFLECRMGKQGLFYDDKQERFKREGITIPPMHAITTTIHRRRATKQR